MKFRKFISILLAFVMVVMTLGLAPAAALADAPAAGSEENLQPETTGEPEQSGESRNRDSRRHCDRDGADLSAAAGFICSGERFAF